MCSDIVLAPPRSLARRAMPSRERTLTFALPALTAAVALAAWQFVAMHWAISPVILPAPSDVAMTYWSTPAAVAASTSAIAASPSAPVIG